MSLLIYLPLNGSLDNYGYGSIGGTSGTPQWINDSPSGQEKSLDLSSKITFMQANSSIAGLKEFTICFWTKLTAIPSSITTNFQDIIGFTDVATNNNTGALRWETGNSGDMIGRCASFDNTTYSLLNSSSHSFNYFKELDIWHHCAFTLGNGQVKSYLDGTLFSTKTGLTGGSLRGDFWLGETNLTYGSISDVRIYDEALSDTEIAKIAQLRKKKNKGCLVWIPAINDWHNQGLDTVNFTVTNASASNPGKIGITGMKGYTNNFLVPSLINCKQFTYTMWVKINTATTTNFLDSISFYNSTYETEAINRQEFYNNSGTAGFWFEYKANEAHNSISGIPNTVGEWIHWAGMRNFETGESWFFKNGIQVGYYKEAPSNSLLSGQVRISESGLDTIINDVRIYNVCLTPNEIKKIAQGKTIHLHLYEQFHHHSNLIKNTIFQAPQKFTLLSGSEGGFQYPLVKSLIISQPYTISCKIRGNADMALYTLASQGNQQFPWTGLTLDPNNYQQASLTFTPTGSGRVIDTIYICTRYGNNNPGNWFEILPSSLKVEEGSQATMYCPSYGDYNNSILQFYDSSGYCNNGIATNANIISNINSPRYCAHSFLNLGTRINLTKGFPSSINPDCTINFWFKPTSTTAYVVYADVCGMSYTGGSGDTSCRMEVCGDPLGNAFLWFRGFLTTSASLGYDARTNTGLNQNQWNMLTLVLDANTAKTYLNSNYLTTYTRPAETKTWKPNGDFHINETSGMAGEYSDFRIFATALSAEDVQELYKMGHIPS